MVPASIPNGVDEILEALSEAEGVSAVTLGRCVEEKRTVAQVRLAACVGLSAVPAVAALAAIAAFLLVLRCARLHAGCTSVQLLASRIYNRLLRLLRLLCSPRRTWSCGSPRRLSTTATIWQCGRGAWCRRCMWPQP